MPVLLSDAAAAKWTLGHTSSQVGEVSISPVTGTSLQLLPRGRMGDITTPFEPSAFQGTGDEVRKGVLFSVPDDVYAGIAAIETWVQGALEEPYAIWNPSVRPPGNYGATLKAKINVSGPHACLAYDTAGQPPGLPDGLEGTPSDSGHRGSRRVQSLDWGGAAPGGHGIDDRRASGQERHVSVSSTVLRAGFLG